MFSQKFQELTKCHQNLSGGQSDVSERPAYRHILKSIVKQLKEKGQKLRRFKLESSLSVHV